MNQKVKELKQVLAKPASDKRFDLQTLLNGVVLVPAVVIPIAAITVVGMLGFVGMRVANNGGLMPKPTNLDSYSCTAFSKPFQLAFRHGMDVVQLRSGGATLWGEILNGKITWEESARVQAALGFSPPTDIVFDDKHALRVIDASQTVRTERVCELLLK